jgi:hypothetical protein
MRRINKQHVISHIMASRNNFFMEKLSMYTYRINFYRSQDAYNSVPVLNRYYTIEHVGKPIDTITSYKVTQIQPI